MNHFPPHHCTACAACVQRCPKQCIELQPNAGGFDYPVVDTDSCINCGLCEKICPVLHVDTSRSYRMMGCFEHLCEDVRLRSSSGGAFTFLATQILQENGVVFGVMLNDDLMPVFSWTETKNGLEAFRGSKYVQAEVGNAFVDCEQFLKQGRKVLFAGTPCQVAGLRHFLRKQYENLLLVDFLCHGVPSPMVWRQYLSSLLRPTGAAAGKNTDFVSLNAIPTGKWGISFRDKELGWEKYGFSIV